MLRPVERRDDGWLLFEASVEGPTPREEERLLAWSGELPGNCKFARGASPGSICVQAELPPAVGSAERVAAVHSGFAAAALRLRGGAGVAERGSPLRIDGDACPDLAALCREAGWPFDARVDGSVAVDLAGRCGHLPALVGVQRGRIAIEAELVQMPEALGPCRSAVAALLLRVNGAFRMARAVLREPGRRALLEVSLPVAFDAAELGRALEALAVAARRSASEARLLAADEGLARAYLECNERERSGMAPLARSL